MAKDPAFLFYPGDWLGGTIGFTRHQKGAYIDLLVAQFNMGRMSISDVQDILGVDYQTMWETKLKAKFKHEDGLFFNKRLEEEHGKRKKFSESRRNNLKNDHHMDHHMENENENENKDEKEIEKRKLLFTSDLVNFIDKGYSKELLGAFHRYWTERSPKGRKMRFEMEKVFDISRRLTTWANNDKKFSSNGKQNTNNKPTINNTNEVDLAQGAFDVLQRRKAERDNRGN